MVSDPIPPPIAGLLAAFPFPQIAAALPLFAGGAAVPPAATLYALAADLLLRAAVEGELHAYPFVLDGPWGLRAVAQGPGILHLEWLPVVRVGHDPARCGGFAVCPVCLEAHNAAVAATDPQRLIQAYAAAGVPGGWPHAAR